MSSQTGSSSDTSIRVLLTVPHLESVASPYREMMALARYLPRPEFSLTICSLRENGLSETAPRLHDLGVGLFVARFRPRGKQTGHAISCLRDQKRISGLGPFDLQHSLDFSSAPLEAGLARFAGRRFIFTQRNLNEGGRRSLLRLKCRLSERVVAISAAVRALLEDLGVPKAKIVDIGLGIDDADPAAFAPPAVPTPDRYVLSVGQIERRKRHQDAIEAFARIAPEIPDVSLLIAGRVVDPAYAAELKALAAARNLGGRIQFLGPRDDVMALMRRAACLIHCPESEAVGWVLLEAMSAGLPIVATSVGGIPELIEDGVTGLMAQAGDVNALALSMRRLVTERDAARSLAAEASRQVRERHSASAMVNRLADLYRNVCRHARAR